MDRYRLGLFAFLVSAMSLGVIWWIFKPVIDEVIAEFIPTAPGITSWELSYFALLPIILISVMAAWLVLQLVRKEPPRDRGGRE